MISPTVKSVSANIVVVSQREGKFKVQCTSRGSQVLSMNVTGPDGVVSVLDNITAVDTVQRMGNDTFIGITDVISRKKHMDMYWCTASNRVSVFSSINVTLKG